MSKIKYGLIMSFQEDFRTAAEGELMLVDGHAELIKLLDGECGYYGNVVAFEKLSKLLRKNPPVFIRHIHPAVELTADLETLTKFAADCELPAGTVSVQCRIIGECAEKPYDINTALADILQERGRILDVKNPDSVLSVTVCGGIAYVGTSRAEENLSSWAGGRIRFKREEGQLSRAEFKLLEAQTCYDFAFEKGQRVLDLGAAPGGWTRVALAGGASVTAVDPAHLDESIADAPGLIHKRQTAQEYLEDPEGGFDYILNDMRMEPEESAGLINKFYPLLKDDGTVIMTLKLQNNSPKKQMLKAVHLLENFYTVKLLKQLFHNRSEVTVILKKQA